MVSFQCSTLSTVAEFSLPAQAHSPITVIDIPFSDGLVLWFSGPSINFQLVAEDSEVDSVLVFQQTEG